MKLLINGRWFIVIKYLILDGVVDFLCLFDDYEFDIVICMDFV